MNYKLFVPIIVLFVIVFMGVVFSDGFLGLPQKVHSSPQPKTNKVTVTTSLYPLYYFASVVGGDKASVINITPPGTEPHDYEPSSKDIAQIQNSKLLIINGALEPWEDNIRQNLEGKNIKVVAVGENLANLKMDPHVWLSPKLAKSEVEAIKNSLTEVDPQDAPIFENNAKQLTEKLDQLDQAYKQGLSNCQTKNFITSHAAFGYLAKEYGLSQVPITGISPDQEPSTKQLSELTQFAKDENVKYIFFESLVSPKLAQTLASEVGAQTLVLDPLEGLSDDYIKSGKDYFTVMQENLKNLRIALGCS